MKPCITRSPTQASHALWPYPKQMKMFQRTPMRLKNWIRERQGYMPKDRRIFSLKNWKNHSVSVLLTCISIWSPFWQFLFLKWTTAEYMALPVSQYSVLDAERIERVDETTFKCYAYKIQFFSLEICPVLTVKVESRPDGCCIRLLSCNVSINQVDFKWSYDLIFIPFDLNLTFITVRGIPHRDCSKWEVWRWEFKRNFSY